MRLTIDRLLSVSGLLTKLGFSGLNLSRAISKSSIRIKFSFFSVSNVFSCIPAGFTDETRDPNNNLRNFRDKLVRRAER